MSCDPRVGNNDANFNIAKTGRPAVVLSQIDTVCRSQRHTVPLSFHTQPYGRCASAAVFVETGKLGLLKEHKKMSQQASQPWPSMAPTCYRAA